MLDIKHISHHSSLYTIIHPPKSIILFHARVLWHNTFPSSFIHKRCLSPIYQFGELIHIFQNHVHLSSFSEILSTLRHRWLLCPHLPHPLHWSAFFGFRWFSTKLWDPWRQDLAYSLFTFIFPKMKKGFRRWSINNTIMNIN